MEAVKQGGTRLEGGGEQRTGEEEEEEVEGRLEGVNEGERATRSQSTHCRPDTPILPSIYHPSTLLSILPSVRLFGGATAEQRPHSRNSARNSRRFPWRKRRKWKIRVPVSPVCLRVCGESEGLECRGPTRSALKEGEEKKGGRTANCDGNPSRSHEVSGAAAPVAATARGCN